MNAAWLVLTGCDLLAWTRRLLLTGTPLAACEPKGLRYRLLHACRVLGLGRRRWRLPSRACKPYLQVDGRGHCNRRGRSGASFSMH